MELSGKFEKGTFAYMDCPETEVSRLPELAQTDFFLTGNVLESLNSYYSMKHGCCDIPLLNSEAVLLSRYDYEDDYGRPVVLGCAESEKEHSQSRSSYVSSICASRCLRVGRIIFMFQHSFCAASSVFAYISWFDGPH
jgi:hypothetical protein